jgi:uroporphyrinogen-III synthase
MRTVILTRPRPESEKMADDVRRRGFEPFIEPLLEIIPLDVQLPDMSDCQALVFTSTNGVDAFCRLSDDRSLPIFTVGTATAARAGEVGFQDIAIGNGDINDLNRSLAGVGLQRDMYVLHICGVHTAGDVLASGTEIRRLPAYEAKKAAAFTAACIDLLKNNTAEAALFYSPRTAETFNELAWQTGLTMEISTMKALCMSRAVLKCVDYLPWLDVRVAGTPTGRAMLRLLDDMAAQTI